MKKYLFILLLGVLSISLSFGMNDVGLLSNKQDSILVPVAHSIGKRLEKGTWLFGATLSANLTIIPILTC